MKQGSTQVDDSEAFASRNPDSPVELSPEATKRLAELLLEKPGPSPSMRALFARYGRR